MDFALTAEAQDLAAMLREVFADRYGSDGRRDLVDSGRGYSAALWETLRDLELPGLALAEEHGGSGAGPVELTVLMEEYGRALVASPLFATSALAAPLLEQAADARAREQLAAIAGGEVTATWALLDRRGEVDVSSADVQARRSGADWALSGTRRWVIDGATSDLILTIACADDGPDVFLVRRDGAGVSTTIEDALDRTIPLATVHFDGADAVRLQVRSDGIRRALALARLALSAQELGALGATQDLAVGYAAARTQFGRPIGSFQGVKHRCADIFIDTETTRWVVYYAATVAANPETTLDELEEVLMLTRMHSAAAAYRAAANLLQVLGGIGYTWEHDGHLYYKRATATSRLLGSVSTVQDAIADLIEAEPDTRPHLEQAVLA